MYGPLMHFGPMRADEVGYSHPVVQSNSERKDIMTTKIRVDHKGLSMAWEFEDGSAQADQVAATVIDLLKDASGIAAKPAPRKRRRMSSEDYARVAEAWKSAPEGQRNKAVRDLLGTSRQNATNYIHRCRALGLLPYPPKRPSQIAAETGAMPSFAAQIGEILNAHRADS